MEFQGDIEHVRLYPRIGQELTEGSRKVFCTRSPSEARTKAQNLVVFSSIGDYSGKNKEEWRRYIEQYFEPLREGVDVSNIREDLRKFSLTSGNQHILSKFRVEFNCNIED